MLSKTINPQLTNILPKRLNSKKGKYDDVFDSDNNSTLDDAGIPCRFIDKEFIIEDGNKKAWKHANLIAQKRTSHGLYLFGGAGSGKSHLASWVLQERLKNDKKSDIAYVNLVDLLITMQGNFDTNNRQNVIYLENLIDIDLLVLDDLGAEKTSEWSNSILYFIIDGRYSRLKQTIITTNYGEAELAKRIGDRLLSRINEMCKIFQLISGDKRIQK